MDPSVLAGILPSRTLVACASNGVEQLWFVAAGLLLVLALSSPDSPSLRLISGVVRCSIPVNEAIDGPSRHFEVISVVYSEIRQFKLAWGICEISGGLS